MRKGLLRVISAVVALVLCLTVTACTQLDKLKTVDLPATPVMEAPVEETETPAPVAGAEPELPPETDIQDFPVIVAVRKNTEVIEAPDGSGERILTFSYESPIVSIEGNNRASQAINDVLAGADDAYYTGSEYHGVTPVGYNIMLEQAEENYYLNRDGKLDTNTLFECSRRVKVQRADDKQIAITLSTYVYTGRAEGEWVNDTYYFDAKTGILLTEEEAGQPEYSLPGRIMEDPAAVDIIAAERLQNSIEIMDMVSFDSNGEAFAILCNGAVYSISFSEVAYSDTFYDNGLLWYCSAVRNQAIELKTVVPEGMPNLLLSYEDASGNVYHMLVTESGDDGRPLLIDMEMVNAVG